MPIYYQCMACREEIYLPDSKAGLLASCPRCRLKFLAPAPNMQMIPTGGAPPPAAAAPPPRPMAPAPGPGTLPTPANATSRPNLGAAANNISGSGVRRGAAVPPPQPAPAPAPQRPAASPANSRPPLGAPGPGARPPAGAPPASRPPAPAARPVTATPPPNAARPAPAPAARAPAPAPAPPAVARPSPPPSYPRDAAKPPLYPLDDKKTAPAAKKDAGAGGGLFGVKSSEFPSLLFGSSEESMAMRPSELFAEAIPSAPDAELDDEMDVPIDLTPSTARREEESDDEIIPAADEGGGVTVPVDADESSDFDSSNATDVIELPRDGDSLISMDEIFSGKQSANQQAAETPAFGAGGVLPAPYLKPAEPAAEAAPEPEPAPDLAPETRPAAAATTGAGPVPFALIPIEGISDARFDLPGGGVYLLGRDKDAQVKILSTSVSRRHARIDATGNGHVLIDLGSANGTQVNGQSVARQPLRDGDLIRMGKVILRYAGPFK